MKPSLLTAADVAAALDITRSAAYRLMRAAGVVRLGRSLRVHPDRMDEIRQALEREVALAADQAYAATPLEIAAAEVAARITCGRLDWTYVVTSEAPGGLVKIGRARRLPERMRQLELGSPVPLRLVALAAGYDFEERLHHSYASSRRRGEWFSAEVGQEIEPAWLSRPEGGCLRCALDGRCRR